eukprot:GHVO01015654.1.p1 GENE.GHVO01015654.1~~GHVO01015654.1.p1  ORF type:complete len:409 (+),score=52.49 GHVO01015654.1:36-1262(+)
MSSSLEQLLQEVQPKLNSPIDTDEKWDFAVDNLRDTRVGKRTPLLLSMVDCLTSTYAHDKVERWRDTIISCCLDSVQRGSQTEAVLGSQCIGIACLSQGKEEIPTDLYDECMRKLQVTASRSADMYIRMISSVLIGIIGLIGCDDDARMNETIKWFEKRSQACRLAGDSKTRSTNEAAEAQGLLLGWQLVSTGLSNSILAQHYSGSSSASQWSFALKCVRHADYNLQLVAGETIAMLMDAKWRTHSTVSIDKMERRHAEEVAIIRQLSSTSGARDLSRHLGKDDKREQISRFRQILATVEEGTPPEVGLCVGSRSRTLTLKSWVSICRYDIARIFLRGSFSLHLEANPTLIFLMCVEDQLNELGLTEHIEEVNQSDLSVSERKNKKKDIMSRRNEARRHKKEHADVDD